MRVSTLRVASILGMKATNDDAERRWVRSHAEHGNEQCWLLSHGDGGGGGERAAVRDADQHVADSRLAGDLRGATAQHNGGLAALARADFDVAPTDAAAPAGAQRLHYRFFGGPAAGVVLSVFLPPLAV